MVIGLFTCSTSLGAILIIYILLGNSPFPLVFQIYCHRFSHTMLFIILLLLSQLVIIEYIFFLIPTWQTMSFSNFLHYNNS